MIVPPGIKIKLLATGSIFTTPEINWSNKTEVDGYAELEISTENGTNKARFTRRNKNAIKTGDTVVYEFDDKTLEITAKEVVLHIDSGFINTQYTLTVKLHIQQS